MGNHGLTLKRGLKRQYGPKIQANLDFTPYSLTVTTIYRPYSGFSINSRGTHLTI